MKYIHLKLALTPYKNMHLSVKQAEYIIRRIGYDVSQSAYQKTFSRLIADGFSIGNSHQLTMLRKNVEFKKPILILNSVSYLDGFIANNISNVYKIPLISVSQRYSMDIIVDVVKFLLEHRSVQVFSVIELHDESSVIKNFIRSLKSQMDDCSHAFNKSVFKRFLTAEMFDDFNAMNLYEVEPNYLLETMVSILHKKDK